ATGRDVGGLDHGPVDRAEEPVADVLRQGRQMEVEEGYLAGVDQRTKRRVALVGRAKADGLRVGERAVDGWAGRSTGKDADLEGVAGGVVGYRALGQSDRHHLSGAGRGESAEADGLAVLNQRRGFLSGQNRKGMLNDRAPAVGIREG